MVLSLIILAAILFTLFLVHRGIKTVQESHSLLSQRLENLQASISRIEKILQNQEKSLVEIQDEKILEREALREINAHNKMTDVMLTKIKSDLAKATSVTKK